MKALNKFKLLLVALLTSTLLFSCSDDDDTVDPTLYDRLGGVTAISAVTDQFLANVAADTVINSFFVATVANPSRLQLLRNNLIDQICQAAGGPCVYKGKSMQEAHEGMGITDEQFNALVGDLVAALDQFDVPQAERDELLNALGALRPDIVGQ